MSETRRLADQYERALKGEAWHGPSWREVLEGVTREAAASRPISGAHNLAEIVAHATTWHDAVRRRLEGETVQVSDEEDWPAPALASDEAWSAAVDRLLASGEALKDAVARFPADQLHQARPGLSESWYGLILGGLQHSLYHAGQAALLRKAAAAAK